MRLLFSSLLQKRSYIFQFIFAATPQRRLKAFQTQKLLELKQFQNLKEGKFLVTSGMFAFNKDF